MNVFLVSAFADISTLHGMITISSLKEKDNVHKVFSELRTNFKKLKREKYCDYISQIEQSVKQNTKRLFSFAKSKQTNVNAANSMEHNGIEAGSPVDIAKLFLYYFQSVSISG